MIDFSVTPSILTLSPGESIPTIDGYNKCDSVKEHGKVLLVNEKTNDPILVIGEHRRGKTAIFLSCHGRG